jgi:hypothetical protein
LVLVVLAGRHLLEEPTVQFLFLLLLLLLAVAVVVAIQILDKLAVLVVVVDIPLQLVLVIHLQHHRAKEIMEEQDLLAVVAVLRPLEQMAMELVDGVKAMVVQEQHLQLQAFL